MRVKTLREKSNSLKPYNPKLNPLARGLRRNQTDAEGALWRHLSGRKTEDAKFRRQQPIGDYVVDFVCFEKHLVIELDGGHHNHQAVEAADNARTAWLQNRGYRVLRFWNSDVRDNIEGVLEVIREALVGNEA